MKEFKLYKGSEMSNADYHAEVDHLSSSNLKMLLKDIPKFHNEKILGNREAQPDLKAFAEGSLVHSMVLEPHLVDEEFVMFDSMRKAGQEWMSFLSAEQSGKNRTILSKPQWMRCKGLADACLENIVAVDLLKGCETELSLFGNLDDIDIKVRADIINIDKGFIADIKTTSYDTDVDSFKFTMKDFGYGLSAALYCQMFEKHFGKPFEFYFIVLGKKDRSCEVYKIGATTRAFGDREVFKALKTFKKCKETGIWKDVKTDLSVKKDYNGYEILEV